MIAKGDLLVDYAFARPSLRKVKRTGYAGILRYLCSNPSKRLTRAEIRTARRHKLAIGVVWEDYADAHTMAGGRRRGAEDAREAKRQADELGIPETVTIFLAVDYDANPIDVEDYFAGAKSVLGHRCGVYGSARVVEHLKHIGLVTHAWQTEAWSNHRVSPSADIFQRANSREHEIPGTDENVVTASGFAGLWLPHVTRPRPKPKPTPKPRPKPKPRPTPKPSPCPWWRRFVRL